MKNILSIAFILVAFAANGQIQEYVIEASDSLITRGVLQINTDKFKATTQVSSDDTTLVSLDYLTALLNTSGYADSLAFHSNTGYLVYYREGVALDSTSFDGRYQTTLTNPVTGTGTANYLPKWTGLDTLGNSLIYDNGTNVGIGTTELNAKLTLKTDINQNFFDLINQGEEGFRLRSRNFGSSYPNRTFNLGLYYYDFENTSINFYRGNSTIGGFMTFSTNYGDERMRIAPDGNVGIGTTDPSKLLHISHATSSLAEATIWNNTTTLNNSARLSLGVSTTQNDANRGAIIQFVRTNAASDGDGDLLFFTRYAGTATEKMRITASGNVGVGVNPAQKLDVNGNIRVRGVGTNTTSTVLGLDSNGDLTTNVTITGGATWKGGWNASTNTPTLSDATGTNGWWYKVTVAGTQNLGSGSITFAVGDDVIHNGSIWQKFSVQVAETDPVFVASDAYGITSTDRTNWTTAYTNRITSLTTTGSSGAATLVSNVLNIPNYTLAGLGYSYPGAGIPISTGTGWGTSITNNSANWNTAYGWGDHSTAGYVTLSGNDYITGAKTFASLDNRYNGHHFFDSYLNTGDHYPHYMGNPDGSGAKVNMRVYKNLTEYRLFEINGRDGNLKWDGYNLLHTGNFTDNSTNWNAAYNDRITLASFSGTTTKTLTLTQQDGGTVTANFTDLVDDADASVTNEGSLTVTAGTATTSVINSNTSGSTPVTLSVDGTNLGISEVGNTISLSNLKPDQTVSLTGSGATSVSGTYPNFTISSTDNNTIYTAGTGISASGTTFNLGLEELTTGAPSLNTHFLPWVNSVNNLHYRVGLLDLQEISGWDAGKLQNVAISSTAPTTDYVMKYNGTTWAPAPDATGSSYWTQASGALYPATITDEVRIGSVTDLGAQKLQVDASSVFRLRNVNTSQPIDLITAGTGTQPYFRFEHDGSGGLRLASYDGSSSWNEVFKVTATSYTTQFPAGLILGASFSTPTAGSIRWNGTNFQGYNGSTWVNLDTQGGTGGMTDPMTTAGDLIRRNGSNVTARLGIGTAGQFLKVVSGLPEWATLSKSDVGLGNVENTALSTWTGSTNLQTLGSVTSGTWSATPIAATHGGTGKTSYTAYALLAGGTTSTGTLQQVAGVGTSGQVLTSNGAGALPSWQAAPSGGGMTDPMTTTGDMIFRNGSNVTARLPKGAEGQILSISSGLPSWINNSSGGWVDNGANITLATSTDNVLIGTTIDSGFKLRVEGNSYHTGSVQVNGALIALKELRLSEYDVVGLGLNFDRPALFISPTDKGIKVKTTATGREIYNITPSVRANALNASSMRYYDGNHITDTLTVNTIYYITHIPQGGEGEILVKQDGTGGRTLTLYFYPYGQTGEPDSSTELIKVTVGATTAIKATANKHTLIRYRRWGTKVTIEYLQEP